MTKTQKTVQMAPAGNPRRIHHVCAVAAVVAYCLSLLFYMPESWPAYLHSWNRHATGWVLSIAEKLLAGQSHHAAFHEIRHAIYLILVLVALPLFTMCVIRRCRLADFGLRKPNIIGLRVLLVGYAISVPLTIYVAVSPEFSNYYLGIAQRTGVSVLLGYFIINVTTETLFYQGILLALCRKDFRWPEPAPVTVHANGKIECVLRWCGLAQSTDGVVGIRKITRWLGLQDGCLTAIFVSGAMFVLVHEGKGTREIGVSMLNGPLLAYVAYRTNTWLVPLLLHVAAGITSFAVAWIAQ